jgi:small-conductance mechanosensitive channel
MISGVTPQEMAFGFGQRRSWVFSAWWYPAVLAISGVAYGGLSLMLDQDVEAGIVLVILGTVLSGLGWALTAWPRFTRKPPKPASDIPRVEQGIRTTPIMIRTVLIAAVLIVGALVLFTPRGAAPETLPLLGMLITWPVGICAGFAYTRRLMMNSGELYARWLARR